MSSLITIDYDFFSRHGMFEDVKLPNGNTIDGMLVYDWQMSETRSPAFEEILWRNRCANFKTHGLDIRKLTAPDLDVADFAQEVSSRFGDATPMSFYGDSHSWAAIVARDFAKMHGPLDVVNFDAHHDLGYADGDALARFKETGDIHCDDWAAIGLEAGWIGNYTIVYPDWLGQAEWLNTRGGRTSKFRKRITTTTWSEWHAMIEEPEVMYFCRSSSWVPPWLDPGFHELVQEFGYADCLDCIYGQSGSPFDACQDREWDWADVDKEIEIRAKAQKELAGLTMKFVEGS